MKITGSTQALSEGEIESEKELVVFPSEQRVTMKIQSRTFFLQSLK